MVGRSLKLTLNVYGCEEVTQAQILERDSFVRNVVYQGNPTEVALGMNELTAQYATLGIAADLTFTAQATCGDGRSNRSTPAAARFFPVEELRESGNRQMVPDVFLAEGGLGGPPVFVGCIGAEGGMALARVDAQGKVIRANLSLPFPCSYLSQLTESNQATAKRWLWQRGQGAFAFDRDLNVTSVLLGSVKALGVAPDGDALIWVDQAPVSGLVRVSHQGTSPGNIKWKYSPTGLLMGNPVVQAQTQVAVLPVWFDRLGSYKGTVRVERVSYASGVGVGVNDLTLIDYGFLNAPRIPPGVFNTDGSVLYFPFQTGGTGNSATSAVMACATNADGCSGAALRWRSPSLTGLVLATIPFAGGAQLGCLASQHTWFLDSVTGQVTNREQQPIVADGSLVALGAQAGLGTDFYVLNGPSGGYPTEIIAVDQPRNGEVYRYQMSGGVSPTSALTVAVDDSGAGWLRIGLRLVKPLPLREYRRVRGN